MKTNTLQKALMIFIIAAVVVLGILSGRDKGQVRTVILEDLEKSAVDPLQPRELIPVLNRDYPPGDPQVNELEKNIQGKIVQWEVKVFEVTDDQNYHTIHIYPDQEMVGAIVLVYPRTPQELKDLDSLKEGDRLKIKGQIQKLSYGKVRINPAILWNF